MRCQNSMMVLIKIISAPCYCLNKVIECLRNCFNIYLICTLLKGNEDITLLKRSKDYLCDSIPILFSIKMDKKTCFEVFDVY